MQYLFVGGPARSGTTAFTRLINSHPHIALGVERYKFLYARAKPRHVARWIDSHPRIASAAERFGFSYSRYPDDVGPHLFESEQFFRFDPGETNVGAAWVRDVEKFKRKLELAVYRGDKVPHVMRYRKLLDERFPHCKFIIMHRDVHRICSSWNSRAQDPKDKWPATNDFRAAVDAVNTELSHALTFQSAQPERCLFVRYESIFGARGGEAAAKILDWLKIKHHPRVFAAVEKNRVRATLISDKPVSESDGQREYIQSHVDWSVIERVEAAAV